MKCWSSRRPVLYVVLPYFNTCGFQKRRTLFLEFVQRIRHVRDVRIVVSETLGPVPLGHVLGVWAHHCFVNDDPLWHKENLINMAVARLPDDWSYVAWIDADVTFLDRRWARQTIEALQTYDVCQLYQTCVNLGPSGEAFKIDKSFAYMYRDSGTPLVKSDRYGFWHPGYAWACTRRAWKQMDGLIDWAILGSADRHMAYALVGRVLESAPGNIHTNYKILLMQYQRGCRGLRLGYVPGTILHHWHGSHKNRKYQERWLILTRNAYDPYTHIGEREDSGVIQLSASGRSLLSGRLAKYFFERREDD